LLNRNPPKATSCDASDPSIAARKVNRSYDARNRLTALTFPDGRGNQVWSYEKDGLPASVITYNGSGSTEPVVNAYHYNKRRLLDGQGESVSQPNWYGWGLGYGYNRNGHLATHSYPTGLTVDYAPNALGQATKAGTFASSASYFPNGALKQFTYGNGIVHTLQQNARQLPKRVTSSGGVSDLDYVYDVNGNPAIIHDLARGNAYTRWMTYDGLDRLTGAGAGHFGGDAWHRFTYDALDNLKSWTLAGVKDYAEYVYDHNHRLTNLRNSAGATVVGLSYDLQGNLQNKNGQGYDFDIGNRLRAVVGKEYYRYDGHGRRVMRWKLVNGGQSLFTQYSQSGQMVYEERHEAPLSPRSTEHIYLAGSLIASRESVWGVGTVTKYQHTDALGSPVATTNETGNVIERNDYEPYGAIIGKPNYSGIGYTGHVMDGGTGLTYMQQRYYDQSVGRFLSVDPVTASSITGANFNRYWYASNNPYKNTDPDGRCDGPSTCRIEWEEKAVARGKMTQQQKHENDQARGAGAVLGLAIVVTRGRIFSWLKPAVIRVTRRQSEESNNPVPQKARDVDSHARLNNGNAPDGYRGNIEYKNDGRGNGQVLPKEDGAGNEISYREYDVNPYRPGVNRGPERIVRGSDGKSYYTADHYTTFTEIINP
jgi:RHS repeat-associated protein